MLTNLVNLMGTIMQSPQVRAVAPAVSRQSNNPFANPFLDSQNSNENSYGKNKPVAGGFFAGYYNGKPNIVGSRLFVEV